MFPAMNSASPEPFSFGVLILAAGKSQRMGRPKLLLPWRNTTVLGHLLAQWQILGAAQVALVHAPDNDALQIELNRLNFPPANRILNPAPEQGMFSSIQSAAQWQHWISPLSHVVLTLGDQPHLSLATLRALVDHAAANRLKISQPLRNGRRRHPVILPIERFRSLESSAVSDLKQFLEQHSSELSGVEVNDPGLDLDLDYPEDYEQARRLYEKRD
jgi:molybdenum cofactor cytidylyltransferase